MHHFLLLGAMCAVVGCGAEPSADPDREASITFSLEEIGTYGTDVLPVGDTTDGSGTFGRGALVQILAVREDAQGNVYVLDSDYKKIAVYRESGTFARLVLGGYGEGPGEFRLPTSFDVASNGEVFVYDYALQRISVFDSTGQFQRMHVLDRRLKDVLTTDSSIVGTVFAARDSVLVAYSRSTGARLGEYLSVASEDREYSPDGVVARLGRAADGDILVARHRPAKWYRYGASPRRAHGLDAIPNRPPWVEGDREREAGHTLGIGSLAPDLVVVLYLRKIDVPGYGPAGVFLDVFRDNGKYLGTARLPLENANAFATSTDRESFLVSVDVPPFARVIRYRLVQSTLE